MEAHAGQDPPLAGNMELIEQLFTTTCTVLLYNTNTFGAQLQTQQAPNAAHTNSHTELTKKHRATMNGGSLGIHQTISPHGTNSTFTKHQT